MKKLTAVLTALLVALCFGAFAEEPFAGLPSPYTDYETLEEINEAAGTNLIHPGVMGVSDEYFFTINFGDYLIAEYNFSVAGRAWCLRGAKDVTVDISGYYIDAEPAFPDGASEELASNEGEGALLARWFEGNTQYVLALSEAGDMTMEDFLGIAQELRETIASI